MVGTAYAKKSGRGRGKALTKPWSRPKTTPTQSRLMRTKFPHFIESTCSDPARKSKTSKAVAQIDLALERGWDARFSMTTSLHNHQLHDCQREYFDIPRSQDEYTQPRRAYPGVATTNSRFISKQRPRIPGYKGGSRKSRSKNGKGSKRRTKLNLSPAESAGGFEYPSHSRVGFTSHKVAKQVKSAPDLWTASPHNQLLGKLGSAQLPRGKECKWSTIEGAGNPRFGSSPARPAIEIETWRPSFYV